MSGDCVLILNTNGSFSGERNQELIKDPFGHHVARNVALTTFLKRREAWEQQQGAVAKRRRVLNSIPED